MTRRLRVDFVETFLVEMAVLGAGLYLYRAASLQLGVTGFAEYALTRRVIALLQPVVVLGMDVGLVRYVAMTLGDRPQIARHVTAAAGAVGAATAAVVLVLLAFPSAMSGLFFGTADFAHLVAPLAWLVAGAAAFPLTYSYLRGRGWGRPANAVQLFGQAVAPVVAILTAGGSSTRALTGIGVGWLSVSAVALLLARPPLTGRVAFGGDRALLRYGVARFPGDLVQVALFSVPPLMVAHVLDPTTAAVFAMGIAIVTMIGSLFAPVGHVVLPAASRMVKEGRLGDLRRHTAYLLVAAAVVATGAVGAGILAAPWIIDSYLGLDVPGAARELRLVMGAAIPFTVYMAARRILDAVNDAPVNAINLGISFGVFAIVAAVGYPAGLGITTVRIAFLVACAVLAVLTLRSLHRSL